MKIHGKLIQEVTVDPLDVIQKLIDTVVGHSGWMIVEDNKFYKCWEVSAGSHSIDMKEEVSKDQFEYYSALKLVELTIKNNGRNGIYK